MNRRRALSALLGLGLTAPLAACGAGGGVPSRPGPTGPPAVPTPTRAPRVPFPGAGQVFLGVQTNLGPWDFTALDAFTAAIHHQPAAMQYSVGWAHDQFDVGRLTAIADRHMLPIIAWEPWDYQLTLNQPAYRLGAIADGRHDDYIRAWATGLAAARLPVVIRFAHEMNGNWYPWCEQCNGNRPGDYVQAWRHVYDIFTSTGADNVSWMWSPNVTYPGAAPLRGLYPGDSYVDWIGLSGYYGTAGFTQYASFDRIFSGTLGALNTFTNKPIVIAETSATNAAGQRTRWIAEMFRDLPAHPSIIGLIWFEAVKEIDWRIANDPAAAHAFTTGAADPRYDVAWTDNSRIRTANA